jgi:hypothetical protein
MRWFVILEAWNYGWVWILNIMPVYIITTDLKYTLSTCWKGWCKPNCPSIIKVCVWYLYCWCLGLSCCGVNKTTPETVIRTIFTSIILWDKCRDSISLNSYFCISCSWTLTWGVISYNRCTVVFKWRKRIFIIDYPFCWVLLSVKSYLNNNSSWNTDLRRLN